MKRKVTLSVFAAIVLIGLVTIVVGAGLGGRPGYFFNKEGKFFYTTFNEEIPLGAAPGWWPKNGTAGFAGWHTNNSTDSDGRAAQNQLAPANNKKIRKVEIDISGGQVVLQSGPQTGVEVSDGSNIEEIFYADDGVWEITAKHNFSNNRVYTITLPEELDSLEVQLELGELRATGLFLGQAQFSTEAGNVVLQDITADTAEFETDVGNMEIKGLVARSAKLEVEMGKIYLEGNVSELLEADCEMGVITAKLVRPAQYSWQAEPELGSIKLDGKTYSGINGHSSGGEKSARPFISLECSAGTIDVSFT